jgi:hypothetical protein
LSEVWRADGLVVDHFREEEVLTRPQFAAVAAEFATDGRVAVGTLLAATELFVADVLAGGADVVVADALVPYVPTLLAMGLGDDEVDAFAAELAELLAPLRPVMVYLDGDPSVALRRAEAREGDGWLAAYVAKLAGYGVRPAVRDVESAGAYLWREREVTWRVIGDGPCGLVVVPGVTEVPVEGVLDAVRAALRAGPGPW